MNAVTDRRSLMLGTIAVAALPGAAIALTMPSDAQWRWKAALRRYDEEREKHNAACDRYGDAQEAYFRERPICPQSNGWVVSHETLEECKARHQKQKAEYELAEAEVRARHDVDRLEAVERAACDASEAALNALLATPAPDLEALLKKAEIMNAEALDGQRPLIDDLRRLA